MQQKRTRKSRNIASSLEKQKHLPCNVRLQLRSATSNVFFDIHVNVHAIAHGKVVLAPADLWKHGRFVDVLRAEEIIFVPVVLAHGKISRDDEYSAVRRYYQQ